MEVEGDHGAGVVGLGEADADLFGVIEEGGVEDFADLGTADEGFGDALGVFALAVHAEGDGGEAAVEDPAFIGLEDVAEQAAVGTDGAFEIGVGAEDDAGEEVGKAAEVLGGGVDDEVGAEDHRMLEGGAEEGIVDHDDGSGVDLGGGEGGAPDVGHDHGGIGGGFDEDEFEAGGRADGVVEFLAAAGDNGAADDAPRFEEAVEEVLGAAIEGDGVNDGIAGGEAGHESGHDGGHAGIEDDGPFGAFFEGDDLVFENFGVGVVEAGVDEFGGFAWGGNVAAGDDFEGALGALGAGEDVSGGAEDGGAGAADGEVGVVTAGEDSGGGMGGRGAAGLWRLGGLVGHGTSLGWSFDFFRILS